MDEQKGSFFSLDRKEGTLAVLLSDSGERIELSADLLPSDAKEGDLFLKEETGNFQFQPLETEKRRAAVALRLKNLWKE